MLQTVFVDTLTVIRHEILGEGQTVNRWYYPKVLERLRENMARKRPDVWKKKHGFSTNKTVLRRTHHYCVDSRFSREKSHGRVSSSPVISRDLTPADVVSVFETRISVERTKMYDDGRSKRNFAEGATCDSRNSFPELLPEMETPLGKVYKPSRRILRER